MKTHHQIASIISLGLLMTTTVFAVNVGDRVECKWKGGSTLYKGTVAEQHGNNIFVHYDDGDKEHTTTKLCMSLNTISVGDRVQCNWKGGGTLYSGRVASVSNARIFVHYDDGDKENTTTSMCSVISHSNPVGTRVTCNWKGGGILYKGFVAETRGSRITVHYDDGDKEQTTADKCKPG